MEPSAGGGAEHLCVLLLGAEEVVTKREVACQWESQSQQSKEVACQSDWAEQRDVGVQVDLLTHQLGWANSSELEDVNMNVVHNVRQKTNEHTVKQNFINALNLDLLQLDTEKMLNYCFLHY